jgi:predicted transcriptional regulator
MTTGNSLKIRRTEFMISRGKIADQMGISESRTQQIEAATRLSSRMSERYLAAVNEILRKRATFGGAE